MTPAAGSLLKRRPPLVQLDYRAVVYVQPVLSIVRQNTPREIPGYTALQGRAKVAQSVKRIEKNIQLPLLELKMVLVFLSNRLFS